jgi:hypothetical protein
VSNLHQTIAKHVAEWREAGYPCDEFPVIDEILEHQSGPEGEGLRFLRDAQFRALETYWYLRLVEGTPHIFDLYRELYAKTSELLDTLDLADHGIKELVLDEGLETLWERVREDDEFVREHRLETLRESITLDYPNYILALAMGAGKTVLIGTIIATEFAMALEYPDGNFVENALVFAPGLTILESLRELARMPFDEILPPRLYKGFAASFKLIFTRDGDADVPVVRGSSFNVVVTNTEKIRIQKRKVTRRKGWTQLQLEEEEKRAEEVANRRLQTIASLPHLAVFSDEAHHTHGQKIGDTLKRVRQTVDYLAANTNVLCVVNTTGTPYFGKQVLKDVVIWYGLAEGIADGVLKEVEDSIQSYRFDASQADDFVTDVVGDFFRDYAGVCLPNGAPAKLAIYFPQTDDLEELRPAVESALVSAGQSPAVVLRNINQSVQEELDAFNRLNDPASPHRVILLVNKGTEGWNCPSLFACALARKLTTSNNFVLQASTRCLRQVPGNTANARIYISEQNRSTLDNQLQETYGETISSLNKSQRKKNGGILRLRKLHPPPLTLTLTVRTVVRDTNGDAADLQLERPAMDGDRSMSKTVYSLGEQIGTRSVLKPVDDAEVAASTDAVDLYAASVGLASLYRLDALAQKKELAELYPEYEVPGEHLEGLRRQLEDQTCRYRMEEEEVEVALAIVKPEGWLDANTGEHAVPFTYSDEKEGLILPLIDGDKNPGDFGFHYHPYNFDSVPERSFLLQMLEHLNLHPDRIEDVYFTGATTDPAKTDFFVEYRDVDGKARRYVPDFLIRLKPEDGGEPGSGKCLIVEIKSAQHEKVILSELARGSAVSSEGRKALAVMKLAERHPDRIRYEIIFAPAGELLRAKSRKAREFVETGEFGED